MALQYTILLLISVFFCGALALSCHECIPGPSTDKCTDSVKTCQYRCLSMTTTIYAGAFERSQNLKTCADSYSCVNGSINYGISRMTLNSECCNSDLCNSKIAPELPRRPTNGKICYTCNGVDCSKILPCEGDENLCITITFEADGKTESQKGCSSRLFCGSFSGRAANISRVTMGSSMQCCEGNLCNSAQSIRAFFFPLISLSFLLFI